MSERDFASAVEQELALRGRRVLRVCDYTEGRRGVFGLRALTSPMIKSAGADYIVLPAHGMPVVLARNFETVRDALIDAPFFLELKDPERPQSRRSAHEDEQDKWLRWVAGGRP
jgi:hypothetical protein